VVSDSSSYKHCVRRVSKYQVELAEKTDDINRLQQLLNEQQHKNEVRLVNDCTLLILSLLLYFYIYLVNSIIRFLSHY